MTLNGRNVTLAETEKFYGAHEINLNEDRPILSAQNVACDLTPCLKKLCQCYFLNNSVKHWPTLIIFGVQHHKETWHK